MVRRAAFTFIELIFAIVIIAITVVSLPMMNQVIAKGLDDNLVQEAIFAAATELNEAVTAHWDENSIDPTSPNSYARVIDHSGNCNNNNLSASYRQMPGHINQPLHRRCLDDNTTTPGDSNTNNTIDALDDMEHAATNIFIDTTNDTKGYKRSYTSKVTVTRGATFAGTANQDIKSITIEIKNADGKVITSLKTYSANIGEVDYLKKEY